jgi:hypothetical protein
MELSLSRVSFYITKLKRLNLIKEVSFTGRTRRLMVLKENWYKPLSKKESCVKARRQTTRKQEGRLRESKKPIYMDDSVADTEQQQATSAPSATAAVFYECLRDVKIPDEDKIWLTKKHPEEAVAHAIEYCKVVPSKKSLAAHLKYECQEQHEIPKTPKTTEKENQVFAKELEENLNHELVSAKGYSFTAGTTYAELASTKSAWVLNLAYKDPDFKTKFETEINKRLKYCFYS